MTAIAFTTGTYRSRVDGTLVLSIEIEPRHAQDALKLFSMPGTPGAIARLQTAAEPAPEREKLGPLAMLAVRWCKSPEFWNWLSYKMTCKSEAEARDRILRHCEVTSRKELDTDPDAASRFEQAFRKPFAIHLKESGIQI